jgi:hypothetical protein
VRVGRALKELGALARIPHRRRTPLVRRAIDTGVAFLFSRDPVVADYPMGWGNTKPNASWFKPGFPIGYVSDVLQTLEVLADLGHGRDPRLTRALAWIETWMDIEHQGQVSKWVTLRACSVLRAAYR